MKKIILILGILFSCVIGIAIASTVTTTDGVNFTVTNDAGVSANMLMSDIQSQVNRVSTSVYMDSQKSLTDTETLAIWSGVNQSAQQALNQWQANQTVSIGTTGTGG